MKIIKISSQGQITLPKTIRNNLKSKQFIIETNGTNILLKPISINVINEADDLTNFGQLAIKSFDYWNNSSDDIYQNFYNE